MTGWRKSSASGADQCCVWVEITPDAVLVREDYSRSAVLEFTHDEWRAFIAGVKAGEFDIEVQP